MDSYTKEKNAVKMSRRHWNSLAKPLYGLGEMEELIIKIAGIQETANVCISKKAVIVMCADNGIIEESISQSSSEVTALVAANIANGRASINRMAAYADAEVFPIDIGMKDNITAKKLQVRKTICGTKNFRKEAALTEAQITAAISEGIELVRERKEEGYQLLATGEMGIGNTTTSSALIALLLRQPVRDVTGRGAGLTDSGLQQKLTIIEEAVEKYSPLIYQSTEPDVWEALKAVGGLDICGLIGIYLGARKYRMPVVLDGLITAAAALCAFHMESEVVNFLLPSHMGKENGMKYVYKKLGLSPVIHAGLRLGEGTGAVMLFPLLDMALKVYQENETFEAISLSAYQDYEHGSEEDT